MGLHLNADDARKGDTISNILRDSGKYVGTITRAEKLLSRNNVEGLGLSIKTDDGCSASYLDVYTVRLSDGERLRGYHLVQSILACLKLRDVEEGTIEADKWDSLARTQVRTKLPGYPALMGKRIGVLLQREISTNQNTGEPSERLNLIGVFDPTTELTASEILGGKTEPKRIREYEKLLERTPVVDRRKRSGPVTPSAPRAASGAEFDDDIPFNRVAA